MKGYGQFCPIAQALEVVGERWTLLIVRELLCGSTRFSDIQRGVPLMSRSVLAQRLKQLCDHGLAERRDDGYALTEAGRSLRPLVLELGNWGTRYARRDMTDEEVDVGLLVWDMQRRIAVDAIPDEPVLVELEFRGAPRGKERFFLHLKCDDVELCLTNPGRDVDLRVATTPRAMASVWLGNTPFDTAARSGELVLDGPARLVRGFPTWLQLSIFATVDRP